MISIEVIRNYSDLCLQGAPRQLQRIGSKPIPPGSENILLNGTEQSFCIRPFWTPSVLSKHIDTPAMKNECSVEVSTDDLYDSLRKTGVKYGITNIKFCENDILQYCGGNLYLPVKNYSGMLIWKRLAERSFNRGMQGTFSVLTSKNIRQTTGTMDFILASETVFFSGVAAGGIDFLISEPILPESSSKGFLAYFNEHLSKMENILAIEKNRILTLALTESGSMLG